MELEKIELKHGSPEWLEFRKSGIGGSDVAAILGISPFKTNVEVWEEKVGIKEPDDISDRPQVQYGTEAEDSLVKLFAFDFPKYEVTQNKSIVYRRGFMFASLDAELEGKMSGKKGFLEIKTTEAHSASALKKWEGHIPDYYYTQLLHYFIVTGRDFAWLKAQIKQTDRYCRPELLTRHYYFERSELAADMKFIYLAEKEFWGYVERKERPPLKLPPLLKNY